MDGDGAQARSGTTSAAAGNSAGLAAQQLTNGVKASSESSRNDRNASSRSSPPPSPSSRRASRPRTSKDTQSPAASQPASRKPSPHREAVGAQVDITGPSPYGTRSRNRTGAGRPNYAEDRDDPMEFEYTTSKKSQTSTPAPSSKAQSPEMQKSLSSQGKKAGQPTTSRASIAKSSAEPSGPQVGEGANIPGTSPAVVKTETAAAGGKKRKAPSVGSSVSAAQGPPPAKRRASAAVSVSLLDRASAMPTFEGCGARLASDGSLHADDGTVYRANDYVYLVCEPPGEPYYIARVMEFLHAGNQPSNPIDEIRINWIYRPRDIGRKATDTRVLFASMHSDPCPLVSLRGKCNVKHRNEIDDFDAYRKGKDNFYFSQMYDRYMRRYYELIPMKQVINVPEHIKRALDQRWEYVSVEIGRGKELTSAVKTCKRCAGYCANTDSVDCAVCKLTYHMQCVQPPLLKKPSRGFGWSCGPCSRKQERKLEARSTHLMGDKKGADDEDEEPVEEEEEAGQASAPRSSSPESVDAKNTAPKATKEQLAQAELWPYRYLGIHCKIEDSLDYDDRIYPRSSSRLGPRHQANVNVWHGHSVEYVKPAEIRRKYGKATAKTAKSQKEALAAIEEEKKAREKRPKWVLDEPAGFVRRGEDHPNGDPACTAQLLYKPPPEGSFPRGTDDGRYDAVRNLRAEDREKLIDQYMKDCRKMARDLGIHDYHTGYLDRALQMLMKHKFNAEAAKKEMRSTDVRKDIKEPKLTKEEQKRFEEGITKFGSNMLEVARFIGKVKGYGEVVRYYYLWKRTPRGKQIWGSYEGRKPKKKLEQPSSVLADDVADDHDDSAFDNDKAGKKKRGFECKHCGVRNSRFWRRAPGVAPGAVVPADSSQKGAKDKSQQLMVALCQRCAGLYRKYGVHWEDIDDVAKRVAATGGRAFKRKQDEELLVELININEEYRVPMAPVVSQAAQQIGMEVSQTLIVTADEVAKKKKADKMMPTPEKETLPPPSTSSTPAAGAPTAAAALAAPATTAVAEPVKKKVVEKPPEPPLVPEQPRYKKHPCAVCLHEQTFGDEFWICQHCRLTVHKRCYGIPDGRNPAKWICDCCMNDVKLQYSTCYECVLCPARYASLDLYEPPRTSHKKKTDREKEKERLEKILIQEATNAHNKRQEEMGWPLLPREALKPTANNNWVHVVCAVFTSQIKFPKPELLEVAEGTNAIPTHRFEQECKICKTSTGACVSCYKCPTQFHVTCAQIWDYAIGFDITPVKSTRKDSVTTVQMGEENGMAEAVICCRDHTPKNMIHLMTEPQADGQTNALQLYVKNFKQADLSLTGTVRKAAAINSNVRTAEKSNNRRGSVMNGVAGTTTRAHRGSPGESRVQEDSDEETRGVRVTEVVQKECQVCNTDASPRWHQRTPNENVCHRCYVQNLVQAPPPPSVTMLQPLPAEIPPVSTPAQPPAPAWPSGPPPSAPTAAHHPAQHMSPYNSPAYEPRQSVPLPRFPVAYLNGVHQSNAPAASATTATPPPSSLSRLGSHTSPSPGPPFAHAQPPPPPQPHMPPPNHHGPPAGLQPSPIPAYSNGYSERRDVSGPGPQGPPLSRLPPISGPPGPQHGGSQANGPSNGPPSLLAHQPPYMPTLNRGPPIPPAQPEHERRYSQPPPPPPPPAPNHTKPPFGPSPGYSTPLLGSAGSPAYRSAPSPVSTSLPPSRGRDMNNTYREASMGPPRAADPYAEGHRDRSSPREKPNNASAKSDLKFLLS